MCSYQKRLEPFTLYYKYTNNNYTRQVVFIINERT